MPAVSTTPLPKPRKRNLGHSEALLEALSIATQGARPSFENLAILAELDTRKLTDVPTAALLKLALDYGDRRLTNSDNMLYLFAENKED